MKAVILAGGSGTRFAEETNLKPKPMIEIGERPILWHLIKIYFSQGVNEFIILGGYKCNVISDYFNNTDFSKNKDDHFLLECTVKVIDTGLNTMTGGRIKKISSLLNDTFYLTYGDGLSNIDLKALTQFHKTHKKLITLTAVKPIMTYGILQIDEDDTVKKFDEKPESKEWINGGFFICEPEMLIDIQSDDSVFEKELIPKLIAKRQVAAYKHTGFWKCMDSLKDKTDLENDWENGNAKWKIW